MPTYTYKHKETEELVELIVPISKRDDLVKENPEYERLIESPMIVSGVGGIKTDGGFKEVLSKVAEAHPNTPLGKEQRSRSSKEVAVDAVVDKFKKSAKKRSK